jgi:hypothetical protein
MGFAMLRQKLEAWFEYFGRWNNRKLFSMQSLIRQ